MRSILLIILSLYLCMCNEINTQYYLNPYNFSMSLNINKNTNKIYMYIKEDREYTKLLHDLNLNSHIITYYNSSYTPYKNNICLITDFSYTLSIDLVESIIQKIKETMKYKPLSLFPSKFHFYIEDHNTNEIMKIIVPTILQYIKYSKCFYEYSMLDQFKLINDGCYIDLCNLCKCNLK